MKYVGLLCNCSKSADPKDELSPSLVNRAFLIDRILKPGGIGVFLYSPLDVTTVADVPGYTIDGDDLKAGSQPVPRVNANWTYGTRRLLNQGIGYRRFQRWLTENHIEVYVPYGFAELVSNKKKAHEVVRSFNPALHPHTEDYLGARGQVESFLGRADSVFIKPRSGNRGNRIFVLRRGEGGFSVKYYAEGGSRVFAPLTLEGVMHVIEGAAGGKSYVIQEGVDSLKVDGSVFDVRVVMVNDSTEWHPIMETRIAPPGSDLSNVFQGGSIEVAETVLARLLGNGPAQELEQEIMRLAFDLARHLEAFYPGEIMELGFDLLLDRERRLHLVEVNSKPGLPGFGSERTLFEWTSADDADYRRWIEPYVKNVASFLKAKVETTAPSEM